MPDEAPGPLSSSGSGGFGRFRLQSRLGGPDRLKAALLVGHPSGHLITAPVASMLPVLAASACWAWVKPGVHLGGQRLLGR